MHTLERTSSVSSVSSTSSTDSQGRRKSVSFDVSDKIYYTFSQTDYDRSCEEEAGLCAALGRIYLSEPEQAMIAEDDDDLVDKNTWANARRNAQGYAVVLGLKYNKNNRRRSM